MAVKDLVAYNESFSKKVHKVGRASIAIAFLLSLSIPIYLTFVLGHTPSAEAVSSGLIFVASFVGIIWVIEPISYFPILGSIGTYMSFLSGNIGNMRMPVVGAVQSALGLEPGTKKLEIAGVFGLVSSNIVNLAILGVVVVAGQLIINALPASVLAAFVYAVPSILGAMTYGFGSKMKPDKLVIIGLIAIVVWYLLMKAPALGQIGIALNIAYTGIVALVVIVVSYFMAVKEK